ncbi:MAG: hypothetical protein WBA43_11420 [Elainellaceae cyanobacterium]
MTKICWDVKELEVDKGYPHGSGCSENKPAADSPKNLNHLDSLALDDQALIVLRASNVYTTNNMNRIHQSTELS